MEDIVARSGMHHIPGPGTDGDDIAAGANAGIHPLTADLAIDMPAG